MIQCRGHGSYIPEAHDSNPYPVAGLCCCGGCSGGGSGSGGNDIVVDVGLLVVVVVGYFSFYFL